MANLISDTIDKIIQYVELKGEKLKLKAIIHLAKALSGAISLTFVLVITFFFLFFLSFAFAHLINSYLCSSYLGFFIISAFYLVIVVIVLILVKRKVIQEWFESLILKIDEGARDEDNQ
ncbi:MAG: phage holin family protein [Bacteroidota bacterium]